MKIILFPAGLWTLLLLILQCVLVDVCVVSMEAGPQDGHGKGCSELWLRLEWTRGGVNRIYF